MSSSFTITGRVQRRTADDCCADASGGYTDDGDGGEHAIERLGERVDDDGLGVLGCEERAGDGLSDGRLDAGDGTDREGDGEGDGESSHCDFGVDERMEEIE